MRVAHINATSSNGSTGRLTAQLQATLLQAGEDCRCYASQINKGDVCIEVGNRIGRKAHAVLSRLLGLQGYFSRFATSKMIQDLKKYKPDIVHLHNLHANYLYFPALFRYLKKHQIATFVTLHDCFLFTGKCSHYLNDGCFKWQTVCGNCPRLKKDNVSWFFDRTEKMFSDKKRWFTALENLHIVGVSKWIADEAKKSFLKDAKTIDYVYNWVDLECFAPAKETQLCKALGLENKKVILGVSTYWTKEKGLEDFIALSKRLDSRYAVVLIGNVSEERIEGTNIIHIPPVSDAKTLARYYNMADVFVNASVQETFGLTTAEALASGTPCVVYNKTACPELIGEGCGYVVEDFEGLLKQVCSIAGGGKEHFSNACRTYAKKMFSMDTNVRKYIVLYKAYLGQKGVTQ